MGIFRDSDHAERFVQAVQTAGAIRDDDTIKEDFGASLYILTGLSSVYARTKQYIQPDYIDFASIMHSGLSRGEIILVGLAGNLYNDNFFDRYTPLDIVSYCDTDGVALAAQALLLRKRRLDINTIYDE